MFDRRRSGVLLHVTSLPSRWGVGDFGSAAYDFVRFLRNAGVTVWQMLPMGPPALNGSPYSAFSAFAGNPLLISPEGLLELGWLSPDDVGEPDFPEDQVDFDRVVPYRLGLLRKAFARFCSPSGDSRRNEVQAFCQREARWLDDYTLFMALCREHPDCDWNDWPAALRSRQPEALAQAATRLREEIEFHQFVQYCFDWQWGHLRQFAREQGVLLLGDVQIFVSHHSADVWAHQELFHLDERGLPTVVAGVPPDYFAATGQRWGNPLYRWPQVAARGYAWWIDRMARALTQVDAVRMDHFRGFESYWEIPAEAETAIDGRWIPGPRDELFQAMQRALGPLPIVAEDLGLITPEVVALRDRLGFPGMRVLQFGFGDDPGGRFYLPHRHVPLSVAYTGTHDNDTAWGWFRSTEPGNSLTPSERQRVLRYLKSDGQALNWDLIRAAWSSVALLAVAPMQDLLGLGSEGRMNTPGVAVGNWSWRMRPDALSPELSAQLRELNELFERGA